LNRLTANGTHLKACLHKWKKRNRSTVKHLNEACSLNGTSMRLGFKITQETTFPLKQFIDSSYIYKSTPDLSHLALTLVQGRDKCIRRSISP